MVERTIFGKLTPVIQPPDLIEIQTKSFKDFLQADVPPTKRKHQGLQGIFKEIFPVVGGLNETYNLDFVRYELGEPQYTPLQALREGASYQVPLNVVFRLSRDGEETKEQSVFMGDIPLMTDDGAFVINGAERVIVSQLHRSPGLCSEKTIHNNGSKLYSVRIIPDRGSWIELQFDVQNQIWVFLDRRRRRRKFRVSTFLRALGYSTDRQILELFYKFETLQTQLDPKVYPNGYPEDFLANYVFPEDIRDPNNSNAIIAHRYAPVSATVLHQLGVAGIEYVEVVNVSNDKGLFVTTLRAETTTNEEEALREIYHTIRPGDPVTASNAKTYITRLFFDERRYDLGRVGRYKLNQKLGAYTDPERGEEEVSSEQRILSKVDVIRAIRMLLNIYETGVTDDIDHLGSRRIRTAGELLEGYCRTGLARTERVIKERMSIQFSQNSANAASSTAATSAVSATPVSTSDVAIQKLVTSKTLASVIGDFFGRSQLSQFMDQTNPLSGLAHKRRLSALGPGGLSRDRAGFEVRDVHPSHYGRICPIETPEGPNIGLISSLGIYAHINQFGFIETPYVKVVDGKVTDEVVYLSADDEENHVVAQANAPLTADRTFKNPTVMCRRNGEFEALPRELVNYMDVSPMQVISIAAGLIPFLEHDDANRALMGANMMRQAVPLLRTERPYVATGLEGRAARDSRVVVVAEEDGKVTKADACSITITNKKGDEHEYSLQKFRRTNASTCFNQYPIVKVGDTVKKGDVLADGPATDQGELALGKNLLVAFMPWCGCNFEDSILVSQRIVSDDVFTSVHITDFECQARETKIGPEEITRDIPNVGEEALRNLDADGVVRVGAKVKPGDILVGKVTPKSEQEELPPEERLLRAIFGDKGSEVRDSSLCVPPGTEGIVMDVKINRAKDPKKSNVQADLSEIKKERKKIEDELKKRTEELTKELVAKLQGVIGQNKNTFDIIDTETGDIIIPASTKTNKSHLQHLARCRKHWSMEVCGTQEQIKDVIDNANPDFEKAEKTAKKKLAELDSSNDSQGPIKTVKVYIAEKKNLSVGDKLAGRHGNKGVVARILPPEDMPFLPNGQCVDIVLNPMGVPSRMNIGQVFETHLGIACRALGLHAGTPVFDGVMEDQIRDFLREAREKSDYNWVCDDCKTVLYDGRTGERFEQRVVVGVIYMLKLHHLVTDKIHARSTGPYSLVTQQPLGGKAQLGGQRMGEMEVWALEAHGVAYALQELLTVKSDDVTGRTRIYESIVKGSNALQAGIPETFSVLRNELNGLCIDMQLLGAEDQSDEANN